MLGGDGQHGAVEVGEEREEGGEGVELRGGDVAKVHRVEHQQHMLATQRGEAHLLKSFRNGKRNVKMSEDEGLHLLLLVVKHRVEGEIRSAISWQEGSRRSS